MSCTLGLFLCFVLEMLQGLCKLSAVGVWIPFEHHVTLYYYGQNLDACYVGYLLSSSLLSKNLKMKVYRTVILPVV